MSSLQVHLDRDNCLEVILVRGKSSFVKELADSLIATKGVKHGRFTTPTNAVIQEWARDTGLLGPSGAVVMAREFRLLPSV
jgi:hypothetical protein